MKEEKIGLANGGCAKRWSCKNINKKVCKPMPEGNKDFVMCCHYKGKPK